MKRKTLRLYLLVASLCLLGVAVGLTLYAFQSRIVFFFSPSDIARERPATGQIVRLGGLVEAGSVAKVGDGATTTFNVTDLKSTVSVSYRGVLPDLFREGQGVVVEGAYASDGTFNATEVLAKHDEKYMPPEVAKALKESGRWQEGGTGQPAGGTPVSAAPAATEANP
ncbi:MAG TPA: cytochrome c maturation protein CcmE [Dongiaceae bacterium]|nr:cytochrome c maturation protein CcmE [Dongiaceae bacterium]